MIQRDDIHWADLGAPVRSSPAKRRPVLAVQADSFNASRINTVVAAVVTFNVALAAAPGNVALPKRTSKLPKNSVVNVSLIVTLDRRMLADRVSSLPAETMADVDLGIRLVRRL